VAADTNPKYQGHAEADLSVVVVASSPLLIGPRISGTTADTLGLVQPSVPRDRQQLVKGGTGKFSQGDEGIPDILLGVLTRKL
jgi:hypothetical protein